MHSILNAIVPINVHGYINTNCNAKHKQQTTTTATTTTTTKQTNKQQITKID
jgi:hypothetical protein